MEVISAKPTAATPGFVVVPANELARLREVESEFEARVERVERAARDAVKAAKQAAEDAKEEICSLIFAQAFDTARNAGRVSELERDGLRELFLADRAAAMTALETEWEDAR